MHPRQKKAFRHSCLLNPEKEVMPFAYTLGAWGQEFQMGFDNNDIERECYIKKRFAFASQ